MHVIVAVRQKCVEYRSEHSRLILAEVAGAYQFQRGAGLWLVFVMPAWVVPTAALGNLLRGQAEQKEIILAGLLRHFNGCTIPRSDGERAVHHEFHIACAASFVAGS